MIRSRVLENVGWCWKFTKFVMPLVYLSLGLSLAIAYISTLEPIVTGTLMDCLTVLDFGGFIKGLFLLFVIQGTNLILGLINGRLSFLFNKRSTLRGESIFFKEAIKRGNSSFLRGREAETLNTLQGDVSVILSIWTSVLPNITISSFTLVLVSYRLISINLPAFFLTVALSILPFVIYHLAGKKEQELNRQGKQFGDRYVTAIQESIALSYECVGKEATFFLSQFKDRVSDNFSVAYKKLNISQTCRVILFTMNVISISFIYFLLGYGIYLGKNSVGDFMAAIMFTQQLRNLINNYGGAYRNLLAQSVSIDRARSFMDMAEMNYVLYDEEKPLSIELRDFSFAYRDEPVLKHVSVKLDGPGLFLVKGKNGTGKTTLLKAILAMVDQKGILTGEITIGGCRNSEEVAYIPSSPLIYTSSIRSNLLLGHDGSDEHLIGILDRVGLSDWLKSQVNGLDTICDQKRMGLSKGQMMRFALASNIARERKVYLVDEIEDGVDADSRANVMSVLKDLSKNHLVVIVSHTSLFDGDANDVVFLSI